MSSRRAPLVSLTLFEGAAVALLARTAHQATALSWREATTAELSLALLWWCAGGVAAWLVVTTTTCAASRAVPALGALRVLDVLTAPTVRRVVEGAVACSLVVSSPVAARTRTATPPSTSSAPPPVVFIAPDGEVIVRPATTTTPTTTTTTTPPPPPPPRRSPAPAAPSCRASARNPCGGATRTSDGRVTAGPRTYVVTPGDNLWTIAAAHLGTQLAAEVAPYWRRVVDANLPTLRSGDPNLIYPGELLVLPAFV